MSARNNRARVLLALTRIRCLDIGNSARQKPVERLGDTLHVRINGLIGHAGGCSAQMIEAALKTHRSADFIDVEINSEGGYCRDAFAIHAALKKHSGFVTTRADTVCASAATIVLAAGDHREAYPCTELVLHCAEIVPPAQARWTAATHKARASSLHRTDERILDIYTTAAGGNRPHFEREMQTETRLPLCIAKSWGLLSCIAGEARWHAGRPYIS